MAAGTLAHLRRGDLDGWILTVFIVVKIAYEQSGRGHCLFSDSHGGVVVDAHLFGALGGAGVAAFLKAAHRAAIIWRICR